jgi:type I restriction enzyme S subunit
MKLETFFDKFDQFADAPDAVDKMRKLILRLAVQGRLKSQGYESGFPQVRMDSLGSWAQGCGFPVAEQGHADRPILFAKVSDMNLPGNEREILKTNHTIDEAAAKRLRTKVHPPGTVIFPKIGGAIATNKRRVLVRPTAIDNNCSGIIPNKSCSTPWLFLVLSAIDFAEYQSGTSIPAVNQGALGEIEVSFPPLAEQKRIVAKVDELMALCDRLQAQQQERDTRHASLARASLARFADAPTPANLPFLFHPSYAIPPADLRKSILTLAVQGKLVPQDPNDEPAQQALSGLEARGGNAKTRRSVPTEVSRPDTLDLENLPESWVIESTARLLQLGAILDLKDGNHGANHPKVAEFTETGLPFITAAQVSDDGWIDYDGAYKVSGEALKRLRVGFAKPNDVIYTHKGSVGRVAICNRECVLTPQTTYYRVNEEVLSSGFVRTCLLSPLFRDQVDLVKRQTTRDFVSINAQYQFFLRVPPLAEQRRIVAKVEQLMALVDALETQLTASRATAANLLSALVAELTGNPDSDGGLTENTSRKAPRQQAVHTQP